MRYNNETDCDDLEYSAQEPTARYEEFVEWAIEDATEDHDCPAIPHCDQCQMLAINGVNCHETGCPNRRKVWNRDEQTWDADTEDGE